ncbi:tRNA (adenosine(37)-N6)-threonylcarbamoyltransferase complex transferase subunit TsaD [Pontibacter russatus]|uniref:tRNA (adenosine(37)-N6)-threonylcarbamoyltransferase complex transferase subunit TsaD n=1 Tax=Pontibacter russatus TaxID=2694929 RepID=UPI001379699D|nr:tRNA (adenosine(37)-N6)-threonylcarbamoyltransferase complex transferase subunit TsaD [Pontibacter russatus]
MTVPTILAIESSCDETSAAVIRGGKVLSNVVATQAIHELYGGVVPELASRAHQQNIIPVVTQALRKANVAKNELNAVAFTRGPGLLGALLVGCSFAKSFALGLGIPLIEVNHMQAHILAHFIEEPKPAFPFLCLTVSGGHTMIVLVRDYLDMQILGQTTDDAVGEAFDKIGKMLGLPYPGGPMLDKTASQGNPDAFQFPVGNMPGYSYSFSGIKTSVLYFLRDKTKEDAGFVQNNMADICASVQKTLIRTLLKKLVQASQDLGINEIAIAGGVSANSGLRRTLQEYAGKHSWSVYIPAFQYCTDNAGMIAISAHYQYLKEDFASQYVSPEPRLKIG